MVWRDFLSNTNLSLRMMFILCQALALICAKCSCHVQLLENVSSRCLCVFTSVIHCVISLFITKGGLYGSLIFRDSDLAGLSWLTTFFAQLWIFSISEFNSCAASAGFSNYIEAGIISEKAYFTVNIFNKIININEKGEDQVWSPVVDLLLLFSNLNWI